MRGHIRMGICIGQVYR